MNANFKALPTLFTVLMALLISGCLEANRTSGQALTKQDDQSRSKEQKPKDSSESAQSKTPLQEEPNSKGDNESDSEPEPQDLHSVNKREQEEFAKQTIEIPETWTRMSKVSHLWSDKKNKQVIVRGAICLQDGLLEMFACPRSTKEHESIVSVHARAFEVHATLLALGIKPGKPMLWAEDYRPVSGPIINVEVWWSEDGKLVKRKAQEMILNTETEKPMKADFVFGGSELIQDEETKQNTFMADFGPFINVANQPDAMIDVSIKSSEEAQGSLFAANPKMIPAVNTKVYVVLSDSGKQANLKTEKNKPASEANSGEEAGPESATD